MQNQTKEHSTNRTATKQSNKRTAIIESPIPVSLELLITRRVVVYIPCFIRCVLRRRGRVSLVYSMLDHTAISRRPGQIFIYFMTGWGLWFAGYGQCGQHGRRHDNSQRLRTYPSGPPGRDSGASCWASLAQN